MKAKQATTTEFFSAFASCIRMNLIATAANDVDMFTNVHRTTPLLFDLPFVTVAIGCDASASDLLDR
ncbi:hypothetical protein BLOT_000344 [Blomia tropicalis]|nr:hypothetical protein BLOT_000344 [Blomia tropicalis]